MCVQGKDAAGACYSLVGIVEHQGSMAAGHYDSYSARLPSGQPSRPHPASPEQATKPEGPGKRATAPTAAAPMPTSEKAVQNGPLPEGRAAKEHVGEVDDAENTVGKVDDAENTTALRAAKLARSALQDRLATGRGKLDAEEMLWFRNSDAHVKRVSWEQVASCDPYLLMYVRTH